MEYQKTGGRLAIKLDRDFNLMTARKTEKLAADAEEICIDLSRSRIVDSEALILLYKLVSANKRVTLVHPPPILEEAIQILGLESVLDIKALTVDADVA